MTREEEIRNKAVNEQRLLMESMDYRAGFMSGAKWADNHPKRYTQEELCGIQLEMMQQRDKRLIEKACNWLKEKNERCMYELEMILGGNFIENFKKAMEE